MNIPGYAGKMLYVDLTAGTAREQEIEEQMVAKYLGGWGVGQKLAYELIPPRVDPLAPENAIILSAGAFCGTAIPAGNKLTVTTKMPLNGAFNTGAGGGVFPLIMKSCGYDHVVITGRCDKPTYLTIGEEGVEFRDAGDLWGKDNIETTDTLRRRHEPCSVIPIGPAGEHLVKASVTFVDMGGTIGAGGLPAIMGSKNLKAIVARQGNRLVTVAHRLRLQKAIDVVLERVNAYYLRPRHLEVGGVAFATNWIGMGKGFAFDQKVIAEIHGRQRKGLACPACPMACKERVELSEGSHAGLKTYANSFLGVWEANGATSPLEAYTNYMRYEDAANRYGLDLHNIRREGLISVLLRLYTQGTISKSDTGGLELGDNIESALALQRLMAYREGFGDVLADGPVAALRNMGKDEDLAPTVKQYTALSEPRSRGLGTMEFENMVNPGGGVCFEGFFSTPAYNTRPIGEWVKQARKQGIPDEDVDRIFGVAPFSVGRATKWGEDFVSVFNSLGLCGRLYIGRFYTLDILAELYSALTGIESTPVQLLKSGEQAWNMWKVLNARAGFDRKDDRPPRRWFEPLPIGDTEHRLTDYYKTRTLNPEDVGSLLDEYYEERGWDLSTGLPTGEKLIELGLDEMVGCWGMSGT